MSTPLKPELQTDRPIGTNESNHHRTAVFVVPRRRWPGVLAAGVIGAGVAAAAVSSFYDHRSVGTRIDAGVDAARTSVDARVEAVRDAASEAGQGAAKAGERVAAALGDAGITAAVKTALAADPALSAVQIAVSTRDGVVSLEGPAPDARSRERAQVLAAAPAGVVSVQNRLVVPPEAGAVRTN